jgi:hypothetical protein
MRQLFFILLLAAAAYYGWDYYQSHKETIVLPWQKTAEEAPAEQPPPAANAPRQNASPPPPSREFVSRIRIPEAAGGQKPMAPPGHVYITSRASAETANGVVAVVPGDLVKLLQRRPDGSVRVTNDRADFELKEDQVTLDPEIAQAAEKRDFEMRMPRR